MDQREEERGIDNEGGMHVGLGRGEASGGGGRKIGCYDFALKAVRGPINRQPVGLRWLATIRPAVQERARVWRIRQGRRQLSRLTWKLAPGVADIRWGRTREFADVVFIALAEAVLPRGCFS
ncbi:MAG: hypothetical protein D6691_07645 [Candidatus Hydrogenedentota bacterium]|nr:MAG: hypothetical protein D6691_07645 [Candidatus Hydrogenedentota bacterium]